MNDHSVTLERVDSRMRWIWSAQWLVFLIPGALIGTGAWLGPARVLALEPAPLMLLAALAVMLTLAVGGYLHLYWRHYRYAEVADGLLIERGVWWRKRTLVPRSRVQHTDIKQGPLQRRMGLAALLLHTAATRHVAVEVAGLPEDAAEALRDSLLRRAGHDAL